MKLNLLSDAYERYIIVKDENTKSGYRILSDHPRLWNGKEYYALQHQYIFVPTPDYPSGYILMGIEYGEIKIYHEVIKIVGSMKEASDWVHENKKESK